VKGAWYFGGYKIGMAGTLGQDVNMESDTVGWAIRSWKYELLYNGFRGKMVLDLPSFGDAMRTQVRLFQASVEIADDGVIGRTTAKALLAKRTKDAAVAFKAPVATVRGIIDLESAWDCGAIGYVDPLDRGLVQKHLYPGGGVTLSQAVRPAWSVPYLSAHLARVAKEMDDEAAVASWNIGEGGAEWWFEQGKPNSGSPSWWGGGTDMSERAWEYIDLVRARA
jgi:hypothetical protein